jgi:hypothetical protein
MFLAFGVIRGRRKNGCQEESKEGQQEEGQEDRQEEEALASFSRLFIEMYKGAVNTPLLCI